MILRFPAAVVRFGDHGRKVTPEGRPWKEFLTVANRRFPPETHSSVSAGPKRHSRGKGVANRISTSAFPSPRSLPPRERAQRGPSRHSAVEIHGSSLHLPWRAARCHHRSADFKVCCVAGFQTCAPHDVARPADLEIGDTAGLETCATNDCGQPMVAVPRCASYLAINKSRLGVWKFVFYNKVAFTR